jgi:hypothetical protein
MPRTRLVVIALVVCTLTAVMAAAAQSSSTDGWVVLPIDEYRALRERALPLPAPSSAPPVDATLTRVDYELGVAGESIAGRALLAVDVLRDGWVRVPIPAGLKVRGASLDGQRVALVPGPPPHVLLQRAGRFVLALDIVLPLTSAAGTESVSLPSSAAPISRAVFTLPRSGVDLTVSGGFVAERAESNGESRWTSYGQPGQPLRLAWRRKVDDRRSQQALRVRARVISLVGLGEEISQVASAVRIEVQQGLAREIAISLPPGLIVNQVDGATVGDWDAQAGTLRVRFLEPVATDTAFVVQGEVRLARDGALAIPIVRVPAADPETGGLAVEVIGAGEIGARQTRGLTPADPSELGEIVEGRESPSMIAYRLEPIAGAEPRSLGVALVRYTPQAVMVANVEEARYRALVSEDGRLLVEARYALRNNQRSFLKVSMPPGAIVWSARVAGRPMRPGVAEGDAILLPLEKGRAGEDAPAFAVELVYYQAVDSWSARQGRARLGLPALDLPVSRTGLELYYSPRFRVSPQPGVFRVEDDAGPFAEALRSIGRAGVVAAGRPAVPTPHRSSDEQQAQLDALVARYNTEARPVAAGSLSVDVTFPAWGPSVFLASELTAEAQAPLVELDFKRTR